MYKILFEFTVAAFIGGDIIFGLLDDPKSFFLLFGFFISIITYCRLFIDKEDQGSNIYIDVNKDGECECDECKASKNEQ